jgi:hypothetical protein
VIDKSHYRRESPDISDLQAAEAEIQACRHAFRKLFGQAIFMLNLMNGRLVSPSKRNIIERQIHEIEERLGL